MPQRPTCTRFFCLLATLTILVASDPAMAAAPAWRWPTSSGVAGLIRAFQPPLHQYGAGHRGVDLEVTDGQQITAPASGVVLFKGLVARIPTLVLDHGGGLRSTYQPVTTVLKVGEMVEMGAVIGVITKGGRHCQLRTCLHFGVRNSAGYLDPVKMIRQNSPVLLPLLHY